MLTIMDMKNHENKGYRKKINLASKQGTKQNM